MSIFKEGPEPLPRCYQYEMHMQVARLFKHRKLDNCHKSTKRGLQRRDVEMAETCGEMEFSPEGGEGEEKVENVTTFRYMVRPLD